MASTEDIEAKLAAYVDGEIDEAGRAEIEQHLASNPQHRQLIAELMQQRKLLANLPREMAPADIAETINAQLERAVLLGDIDDREETASLRINFWPRLRLIAAVIVLTAGLGLTIYFLAPWPTSNPPELATIKSLPTVPEIDDVRPLSKDGDALGFDLATTRRDLETTVVAKGGSDLRGAGQDDRAKDALAAGTLVNPSLVTTNVGTAGEQIFRESVTSQLALGRSPETDPLVVVICTPNPSETETTVTEYLDRNGIKWQRGTEPMPSRLNLSQTQAASASRFRQESVQMKQYAPPPSVDADKKEKLDESVTSPVQQAQQEIQSAAPVQARQAPQDPLTRDVTAQPETQAQQQARTTTAPAEPVQRTLEHEDQLADASGTSRSEVMGQLIFAPQIPRSQAVELYKTLNTPKVEAVFEPERNWAREELARQREILSTGPGENVLAGTAPTSGPAAWGYLGEGAFGGAGGGGAGTQPTDLAGIGRVVQSPAPAAAAPPRLIQAGDTLSISIPQLSGAAGLEADNILRVTDGTIALPLIGPMQAAGLSERQLGEQIVAKYREGDLLPDATAKVTLAPATQPADQVLQEGMQPAQQRIEQEVSQRPLAVQQTNGAFGLEASTTQPAADYVDVVIVLTADPPATQPVDPAPDNPEPEVNAVPSVDPPAPDPSMPSTAPMP